MFILSFFLFFSATILAAPLHPCLKVASEAICEVAPPLKEADRYKDQRTCLMTDTSRYQQKIAQAFALYPELVKQQFCHLKKIYLEQDFFGPAWSAPVDEMNPQEILMGLRKKDLDQELNLEEYFSWFERQSFGGSKLVRVNITPALISKLAPLTFTLLHEIGHAVDYRERHNREKNDPQFPSSWTALHWQDLEVVKTEFDFPQRKKICLNHCRGVYLDQKKSHSFYQKLQRHGFISQLSALNAREDFADSFAHYIFVRYLKGDFKIHTSHKKQFSTHDFLSRPAFSKKLAYLRQHF